MPDPQDNPSSSTSSVSGKKAIAALNLPDDAELPLDDYEDQLISQTELAKTMGQDKAKLFFRGMTTQESSGREDAVSGKDARGKFQVTDNLAKTYKLDNTDPVYNRFMGVHYWDEGYRKAKDITDDPVERAAIATAYFHAGPKAIEYIKRTGKYPTYSDGGTTTDKHVDIVMQNWKKGITENGLDFSPVDDGPKEILDLSPEDQAEIDKLLAQDNLGSASNIPPGKKDISTSRNFFTGTLEGKQGSGASVAPDLRMAVEIVKPNFSANEQAQYALASPEQRREMFKGALANHLGGDKRKAIEAINYIQQQDPTNFDQSFDPSIGSIGEFGIDTGISRMVKAYQSGGLEAMQAEQRKVLAEQEQYKKEQEDKASKLAYELESIREQFKQEEILGSKDPIDKMFLSGLSESVLALESGVAGIGGAIAHKFGLDSLDRTLTAFSQAEQEKIKVIQEQQDKLKKESDNIPGGVMAGAKILGAMPLVVATAGASGIGGVYATTLAQNANQEPLKAITNAMAQALLIGSSGAAQGLKGVELLKFGARDQVANTLLMSPDFMRVSASKIYAAQNPGKVSPKEQEQIDKEFKTIYEDMVANVALGGAMMGSHALGSKGKSAADPDGAGFPKIAKLVPSDVPVKVQPIEKAQLAQDAAIAPTPEVLSQRAEVAGGIKSVEHIISPDAHLYDDWGNKLGRVITSVEKKSILGQDIYYANFTDSEGRTITEMVTKEGAEIFQARLRSIGELAKSGASEQEITNAVQAAQPTEIEIGLSKAEVLLENQAKETKQEIAQAKTEAKTQDTISPNSILDEARKASEEHQQAMAMVRERLAKLKKYTDEPDFITDLRKLNQGADEAAKTTKFNKESGGLDSTLLSRAIVTGYDLYRTLKDAGKGFSEWLAEMKTLFTNDESLLTERVNLLRERQALKQADQANWDSSIQVPFGQDNNARIVEINTRVYQIEKELAGRKDILPYLPDIYEKMQFLNETKTRANVRLVKEVDPELQANITKLEQLVKDVESAFTAKDAQRLNELLPDEPNVEQWLRINKNGLGTLNKNKYTTRYEFSGEPVKLYHATSSRVFDEVGYRKAESEYNTKVANINRKFESGALTYAGFEEEMAKLVEPNHEDYVQHKSFDEFSISKYGSATDIGWYGIGVYMGDLTEASKYASGDGANIRPIYSRIESPLIWDYAKDSSMQRYLQNWKIENGKVLSPEDRAPGSAWKLPKEIHADAENFVREYLEDKANRAKQSSSVQEDYEKVSQQLRNAEYQLNQLDFKEDISNPNVAHKRELWVDTIKELKKQKKELTLKLSEPKIPSYVTEEDLHQLSRGITTIMKDKGYDGVFVIEEDVKGGWNEDHTKYSLGEPTYRIKEYVAFHPDQILSAFEGFTPRDVNTGQLLNPQKVTIQNSRIRKAQRGEAGFIDFSKLVPLVEDAYNALLKADRNLTRFLFFRGKGIANANKQAADMFSGSISPLPQTKGMLLEFAQKSEPLLKALGSDVVSYYKYRIQDRLEGVRSRYYDWAAKALSMPVDDLISQMVLTKGADWYSALKAIRERQPNAFPEAKSVLANLRDAADSGDFTMIRSQLYDIFTLAGDAVPDDIFPQYHSYRAGNRLDQVNALYKTIVEAPVRVAFDNTDATPSQYLGNDNLYFPLIAEVQDSLGNTEIRNRGFFKRAELQKPKSPAAHFTTGLSDNYTTDLEAMQKTISYQLLQGNRAGYIQKLLDLQVAKPVKMILDQATGGYHREDPPGEGYIAVPAGQSRTFTSKGAIGDVEFSRAFTPPIAEVWLPEEVYKDSQYFLAGKAPLDNNAVAQIMGGITKFAIKGILEPVYHSWNVVDGLRTQVGYAPVELFSNSTIAGKAMNKALTGMAYVPPPVERWLLNISAIPAVGRVAASVFNARTYYSIAKALELSLFTKDQVKRDKSWQAFTQALKSGSIPDRIGEQTYSPWIANKLGSELKGPLQWKPIREMMRQLGHEIPEPDRRPGELPEDSRFKGTSLERPLELARKTFGTVSLNPLVFGWDGLDIRSRMASAAAMKEYTPNITPSEMFERMTLLGVYNKYAEATLGTFLKSLGISPFYSASSARFRRDFQALTRLYGARTGQIQIANSNDPADKVAHKALSFLSESIAPYITMWAIAHHSQTGKWPWEDEKARLLKMYIPKESVNKSFFLSSLGADPTKDSYVDFVPQFGGASAGTMFGLDGLTKAFFRLSNLEGEAKNKIGFTDKLGLGAKLGSAQLLNTALHQLAGGPAVHVGARAFGLEPSIYYAPDRQQGGGNISILQHGKETWSQRAVGLLWSLNSALDQAGEIAGYEGNSFAQRHNPWYSAAIKFTFSMAIRKQITQENATRTKGSYRDSVIKMNKPKHEKESAVDRYEKENK